MGPPARFCWLPKSVWPLPLLLWPCSARSPASAAATNERGRQRKERRQRAFSFFFYLESRACGACAPPISEVHLGGGGRLRREDRATVSGWFLTRRCRASPSRGPRGARRTCRPCRRRRAASRGRTSCRRPREDAEGASRREGGGGARQAEEEIDVRRSVAARPSSGRCEAARRTPSPSHPLPVPLKALKGTTAVHSSTPSPLPIAR